MRGDHLNVPVNSIPLYVCGHQKKPMLQTLTNPIMAGFPANPYPHWVSGGSVNPLPIYIGGD